MDTLTISDLMVLLVEPSSAQGRIIRERLTGSGVREQLWARDGHSALEMMRQQQPDLVISAMHLPDMTGTELVQAMRAEPGLEAMPFMLVSSETDEAQLDPIRQAGAIALLPKPFEPVDLRRALAAALDYIVPDSAGLADIDIGELQVLVVDDSRMARRHIMRVLNNIGIEHITEAENGVQAAELIGQSYFDLLVTDYNMPEMDGQALVRYVREHSSQRAIPILMVTSERDASRLSAVRQAGTSAICDKPFETATVRSLIGQILSQD